MYSFYGGQEGRTYHIVKTYPSIDNMTDDFQSTNCQVMFHQYVLIDTTKEGGRGINDYENGRLYCRGFNTEQTLKHYVTPHIPENSTVPDNQSDMDEHITTPGAGAIYVGCIRGADGPGMQLEEVTAKTHNGLTSSAVVVTSTTESEIGKPTTYTLDFDFPHTNFTPNTNTITTSTNATAGITTVENNPFNLKLSLGIPQGIHGRSITGASLSNDRSRLSFLTTTYATASSAQQNGAGPTIDVDYNVIKSISTVDNNPNIIAIYETNSTNTQPTTFASNYTRAVSGHYTTTSSSLVTGTEIPSQTGWPTPSSFCIFVEAGTGTNKHPYLLAPNGISSWVVIQDLQAQAQPDLVVQVSETAPSDTLRDGGLDFIVSTFNSTPFGG